VCTLALYFRFFDDCPLVVAANRDEHYDRPSAAPHVWETKPAIVAGKDLLAGGTWLGVNEHGVLAGILNRRPNGERDPPISTRSRGLLCLDILGFRTAAAACEFVRSREDQYQPFTLVVADTKEAWVSYNVRQQIEAVPLSEGLHVWGNTAEFDARSEKVTHAYNRFAEIGDALRIESPEISLWPQRFVKVLGDHSPADGSTDPKKAICVHSDLSGTVSSSVIVYSRGHRQFRTVFCPGPPCQRSFGDALTLDVK
jgi:uncharacterized protein with NRDE domain